MSAFLLLTANYSFFEKATSIYPFSTANIGFLISLAVLLYAFTALLTVIFSLLLPVRVVSSLLILLAAVTGYFSNKLGIVIDADMIRNAIETNTGEALELFNFSFIFYLFIFAVVPVALIWRIPYHTSGVKREMLYKLKAAAALILLMAVSILPVSDHYASFFREHKIVRSYTNPAFPIYSMGKYIRQKIQASVMPEFITLAHSVERPVSNSRQKLVILVIGETARSDHMSLNGYHRNTNPELSREQRLISYSDISACGTSTAISVPCMFAYAGHDDFSPDEAEHTENALDILKRAGVNVLWRDNNSDSKGVASRVAYEDYKSPEMNTVCDSECRDTGMLDGLQQYIDAHSGDTLIVLHQMGSHGPAYHKRYPQQFEHFKPACHSAELSECSSEEISNAYDNTILYTDYFLSKVIALLKQNTPEFQTAMFYVSDHGESLGEGGIYLHGMPYLFAPDAQTKVPLVAWIGDTSAIDYEKVVALKTLPNSHDALFPTLLKTFEVFTDLHYSNETPLIYLKS